VILLRYIILLKSGYPTLDWHPKFVSFAYFLFKSSFLTFICIALSVHLAINITVFWLLLRVFFTGYSNLIPNSCKNLGFGLFRFIHFFRYKNYD